MRGRRDNKWSKRPWMERSVGRRETRNKGGGLYELGKDRKEVKDERKERMRASGRRK